MSNLREAAQRALEEMSCCNYNSAAERLRHALAQPDDKAQAVEPIPFAGYDPKFCPGSNPDNPQPPAEPGAELSDEQIWDLWVFPQHVANTLHGPLSWKDAAILLARKAISAARAARGGAA